MRLKKCIVLIITLLLMSVSMAQDGFSYTVKVISPHGSPLSGIKVWLLEKSTKEEIIRKTNNQGRVIFSIPSGSWTINLPGIPALREIERREGETGGGSATLTYDLKKLLDETDILQKRLKTTFEEIDMTKGDFKIKRGFSVVNIKVINKSKKPLPNIPVSLVSVNQGKIYNSNSNSAGVARFLVPVKENYAVDIDGLRNRSFTDYLHAEGHLTLTLTYEPTFIKEVNKNDTISQYITANTKSTSSRILLQMTVTKSDGQLAQDEMIYLQQLSSGKVYTARTGSDGTALFLLPIGEKYMIHFEFKKDVDVLNYSKVRGIGNASYRVTYRPNPVLKYPERYIPTPGQLFLEEFDRFITAPLPEPENKLGLFLKWGNNRVNNNSKEAVLQIGIAGTNNEKAFTNVPELDIAFVIDKSGSMEGYDRISTLKTAMIEFVDKLRPTDNVSLITFNDEASLEMELGKKASGAALKEYISFIEVGGGTNIYKGLQMAYEQILLSENTNKQLILLTDGHCSTDPITLIGKAKEIQDNGVGLSAIGVGEDYNYSLLNLMTEEKGGFTEHVVASEDIPEAFQKQLSNLIFPIAQEAKLEISFSEKVKYKQLFGLAEESENPGKVSFELGNLYKGYNKVALAQFDIKKPDQAVEGTPVVITLSYLDLQTNKRESVSEQAKLKWEPSTGEAQLILDSEMKKMYAIAIMNQALKNMAEAFAANEYQKAKAALESAKSQIREFYPKTEDKDVETLMKKLNKYARAMGNVIKNNANQER